jgi:RNA polymerase sigma-70 factor (ECF subfamily)
MEKASPVVCGRRQRCGELLLRAFGDARAELTRRLAGVLGSLADAEDAVQEAFLKCWRHRRMVAGVRDLRAWIFRVGLNTARDLHRSAWRRRVRRLPEHVELGGRPQPSPVEAAAREEVLRRLRVAVVDLRPEERAIFLLRQNSHLTYARIAALRHTPLGTVKTQMRAALQKLRLVLQEEGEGAEARRPGSENRGPHSGGNSFRRPAALSGGALRNPTLCDGGSSYD